MHAGQALQGMGERSPSAPSETHTYSRRRKYEDGQMLVGPNTDTLPMYCVHFVFGQTPLTSIHGLCIMHVDRWDIHRSTLVQVQVTCLTTSSVEADQHAKARKQHCEARH